MGWFNLLWRNSIACPSVALLGTYTDQNTYQEYFSQPTAFTCFINSNTELIAIVHMVTSHTGDVLQVQLNTEGLPAAEPTSSAS